MVPASNSATRRPDEADEDGIPLSILRDLYLCGDTRAALHFMAKVTEPSTKPLHILVTGGAGFVGSHLVDRLMLLGHCVTVIDNFHTGRRENVAHWQGHSRFRLLSHDVQQPLELDLEHMTAFDQIYHLACPASPPHYQHNPIRTVKTSVLGTLNMLGVARRHGARFLLASTSEVYGDPQEHPQNEEYRGAVSTTGVRACYDEGKRCAETLVYCYERQWAVSVRVARIFNTYGPRMDPADGRVVSNFVTQALAGQPLTVYGSGQQTRSFQYALDLVRALIALMASDYAGPVNVGNPEEYPIIKFAYQVQGMIPGCPREIIHMPEVPDDPQQRRPDIGKANEILCWQPRWTLNEGLIDTIEYFCQRQRAKPAV